MYADARNLSTAPTNLTRPEGLAWHPPKAGCPSS